MKAFNKGDIVTLFIPPDNMSIHGELSQRFPEGNYTVEHDFGRYITISNSDGQKIKLNKNRFKID